MLEKVNLDRKVEKEEYQKTIETQRIKLGELQRKAKEKGIPVIILFEGWDAAGKGTVINELLQALDPRGFNVYQTIAPNEEERLRPFLWRFWIKTPQKGRIAIFDRSWYRKVLYDRVEESLSGEVLERSFTEINNFEKQLTDAGNIIIKLFLHISKKVQKERFKKLEENPATSWRVTAEDWKHHKAYEQYFVAAEQMLEKTESEAANWTIVEAHDKKFAALKIFDVVIKTIEDRIQKMDNQQTNSIKLASVGNDYYNELGTHALDDVDIVKDISIEEYKKTLKNYQKRLWELEFEIYRKRIPVIVLYEGWDAAGKGGNIRRLTQNLDPRGYEVVPIAAPNDEEKSHHYLWRFWKSIPKAGHITIFDRTWYGRVLVERVEGFCGEGEWKRAYKEINDMEQHLASYGTVIAKFWLNIDKDEQLKRFNERQNSEYKQWKITNEDWRNREKWDQYKEAVDDMLLKTSTTDVPWTIVESNSKNYARIKTIKTLIDKIEDRLKNNK